MEHSHKPSPWRRVAAYLIDSAVIAAWVGVLTLLSLAADAALGVSMSDIESTTLQQLIIVALLTLPAVLYFAISEASSRGATLGKRALRLRVERTNGAPAPFSRTLARAALKLAPWELAHTGVWSLPADPEAPAPLPITLFTVSMLLALTYAAGLFTKRGRTLYDLASGLRVRPLLRGAEPRGAYHRAP